MLRPKKADLMNFVGEMVTIRFHDGTSVEGKLGYANKFSPEHDYRKPEMFYINILSFRVSHVREVSSRISQTAVFGS